MRIPALLTFAVTVLAAPATRARTLYLSGEAGATPVLAKIEDNDNRLSGWWLDMASGKQVVLAGGRDAAGAFHVDLDYDPRRRGHFEGVAAGGRWSGPWRASADAAPIKIVLSETPDTLAGLDGAYRCSTKKRDAGAGWTYSYSLDLKLARGGLKSFQARLAEHSAQDGDQGCAYSFADFTQTADGSRLSLEAKDEDDPPTDDSQRCTIRVIGVAGHLLITFGDASLGKNDDCRYSGTTAYCSPRAWMADLLVDRKTGGCVAIGD